MVRLAQSANLRSRLRHVSSAPSVLSLVYHKLHHTFGVVWKSRVQSDQTYPLSTCTAGLSDHMYANGILIIVF